MPTATETQIPLSLYLWKRIRQLGARSVMGVPGDMNLELLDYIDQVEELSWVGNANELNSAYAADGYARVKGCPGVIVTTMGVGELSALNGVAGAYTEQVKLIHVVWTTATHVQAKRLMIHHNLGPDPDHKVFEKISTHVRCAYAWLEDKATAAAEVDRVIRECMLWSLPVYLFVPMDYVHVLIEASPLRIPIDLQRNEAEALNRTIQAIKTAKNPILLVDCLTDRHAATEEARKLADLLGFPIFSTSMGKTIIDETHPKYGGVYNGEVSYLGVKRAVEESDCILNIGPLLADSNTGGHTREIRLDQVILVEPRSCTILGTTYAHVYLKPFLQKLLVALQEITLPSIPLPTLPSQPVPADTDSKKIVQSWIWKRLGELTRPGDILIAESGTAQFGFPDATFQAGVKYITQVYYGSIGYSVGCCLGAAIAQGELQAETGLKNGRTILVVGDGSLQLTVQEIGTMIRLGLSPLLIVINNKGYTIERAIHGPQAGYNDISSWRHQALLNFFGARSPEESSREVHTKEEMDRVFSLKEYQYPRDIQLLEVHMDVMDIPWRLRNQITIVNARAKKRKAALEGSANGVRGM
ncbi:pyruvate decarboxylase [Zopfia rhizophila CBS 207.26]|uniref:Pyruvate decarboxylase n=1 Tax=Zopfia rhizophila CBS 207.26 TaxID=1314779 RepID=A0A6A6D9M8_9PEZI|nr:pyruvate decarboxylase [Zopfia rhizophila CBS 207.26]